MIGSVVSHYKILSKLGEGGMGVVYKAHDTELDRAVALKFLPHGIAADESEQARFMQEAKAASALNHPNICAIHTLGEHEGERFIDMEFVDGKTLREIVPIRKIQDAITYAIQIAEALQEAHTHGIIHRDIKAENIMVNSKNQVKVMDFGLAKLKGSLKITKKSSTIGTFAYMAPEQLQGEEVDARSDIFSFGIVLYEMLAGHLPFRGEHDAAMMYSIVNEEPEPLQPHVQGAPSELLHILDRALEKDKEERYQSIHEMLIDLRRLWKDSSRILRHPFCDEMQFGIVGTGATAHMHGRWKWRLWFALVGSVAICIGVAVLIMSRFSGMRLNPNRTSVTLNTPFKEIGYHSLSRDGNWIAFPAKDDRGKWDVRLMNTSGGTTNRITSEYNKLISSVDISPDVSQIVYDCWNGEGPVSSIRLVASQGGASRAVADTGYLPRWKPDGKRIGYLRFGYTVAPSSSGKLELWSVNPDGTERRLEFTDTTCAEGAWAFSWSPDGRSIGWIRNWAEGYGEVMVCDLTTGSERQVTSDGKSVDEVIWASHEVLLFVSTKSGQSNLWAIPADGGEQVQVTEGGVPIQGARISADGRTLVYLQQESVGDVWITDVDGSNPRQVTSTDVIAASPRFSPDGKQIAVVFYNVDPFNAEAHLFVLDRDGNNQRQVTFGAEEVSTVSWSPDGKWLAYSATRSGESTDSIAVYLIQPFNPGPPRLLCRGRSPSWLDNENLVVYCDPKTLRYSLKGGVAVQVYKDSTFAFPLLGHTEMVVQDIRKGREGLWSVSVDAVGRDVGEPIMILPATIGNAVSTHDRRLFIYRKGEDELWRVWTSSGKHERIGTALPGDAYMYNVGTDGEEILWVKYRNPSKLVLVKDLFE